MPEPLEAIRTELKWHRYILLALLAAVLTGGAMGRPV